MKTTNLIKISLIIIMMVSIITLLATEIYAVDSGWDIIENTTTDSNTTTEENTSTDNTTTNESENMSNTAASTLNSLSNTSNSSSTSTYNNVSAESTELPDTGLESAIPVVVLAVVFAISAIFAYKKIKEYSNI